MKYYVLDIPNFHKEWDYKSLNIFQSDVAHLHITAYISKTVITAWFVYCEEPGQPFRVTSLKLCIYVERNISLFCVFEEYNLPKDLNDLEHILFWDQY